MVSSSISRRLPSSFSMSYWFLILSGVRVPLKSKSPSGSVNNTLSLKIADLGSEP